VVNIVFAGSLDAFEVAVMAAGLTPAMTVCVVATAAAFRGPDEAIAQIQVLLAPSGVEVSAVSAINRAGADDPGVVASVKMADLVVVADGATLHARSVWRHSALGDALGEAALICVGSTGSVLGETMIDPRGGAPTTGLGFFEDVVVSVPVSAEQSQRSRQLLGDQLLVELGPRSVVAYDGRWRVVADDDIVVTRGGEPANLSD
jgi:hypothetical protein